MHLHAVSVRNLSSSSKRSLLTGICAAVFLSACSDEPDAPPPAPPAPAPAPAPTPTIVSDVSLTSLGVFETGVFDDGAAEIVTFDPATNSVFVINSAASTIDVIDISDPTTPTLVENIDVATALAAATTLPSFAVGGANSIAVSGDILAVAIEADSDTANGMVGFFDTVTFAATGLVEVGVLPDMVTFSPDGNTLLVANEGEVVFEEFDLGDFGDATADFSFLSGDENTPGSVFQDNNSLEQFTITDNDVVLDGNLFVITDDPQGSVSVIDLSNGVDGATAVTDTFEGVIDDLTAAAAQGIRTSTPLAGIAEDFEPEFIAVSSDSSTAFVALQENNAIAVVDIATAEITSVFGLGVKDHSIAGNEIDANNTGAVSIQNQPVSTFFQPDAIAAYEVDGETFIVTANEGDGRDFEVINLEDVTLDGAVFPNAAVIQDDGAGAENIGNFEVSVAGTLFDVTLSNTNTDGDDEFEELIGFGARSFSIFQASTGELVFDSGADFENITAEALPNDFNANNDDNTDTLDDRSDDAGPEPEGVAVGQINDQTFAFIGLERVGGIMVYDVTDPTAPVFQDYVNMRNFDVDVELPNGDTNPDAGDLGPEGLAFVSAEDSPTGAPLLIVGNEVSGTTRIFEVTFTES